MINLDSARKCLRCSYDDNACTGSTWCADTGWAMGFNGFETKHQLTKQLAITDIDCVVNAQTLVLPYLCLVPRSANDEVQMRTYVHQLT